jgi:hypothetical protein
VLLELLAAAGPLESLVSVVAVVAAGYWTVRKYVKTREGASRIDVTAKLDVLGVLNGDFLAVVTGTVKNSGKVRHYVRNMHFSLRGLTGSDALERLDKALGQVEFPLELYNKQRMFPEDWGYSFVEPGETNNYRYSVIIPGDVLFALVSVKVILPGDDEFSASWQVFKLP